ncbi:hypothetical protein D3C84_738610 [compost metagenome]
MPADAGVDEAHPGLLQRLPERYDLLQGGALLHQIQHGEAEDDDEVGADPLANGPHDFQRETHAVFAAAAPAVAALVGTLADELVDEITFRPHHFHTVIARRLGQCRGRGEVPYGAADLPLAHGPRLEWRDGSPDGARRQAERMIGIATGMEDLQGYLAPLLMHGAGHLLVLGDLPGEAELGAMGYQAPPQVGGYAAGDYEADTAAGALGIEGGQLVKAPLLLLEAGVHGAHQYPVLELGKAEIQGCQQRWIQAHDALLLEADAQDAASTW